MENKTAAKDCNIIKDLLPLYVEQLTSEDTNAYVAQHLDCCRECSRLHAQMAAGLLAGNPADTPQSAAEAADEAAPLRNIKRLLFRKKLQTIFLTVLLMAALLTTVYAALDAPGYIPYQENPVAARKSASGARILLTFSPEVTGYSYYGSLQEDGSYCYRLEAWTSVWDKLTDRKSILQAELFPASDVRKAIAIDDFFDPSTPIYVYYQQNNGAPDVCIYSSPSATAPAGDVISLPRLTLNYYLLIAAFVFLVLALLCFLLRKKKSAFRRLLALASIPGAYLLGHILVAGFFTPIYNAPRAFSSILLVSLLLYLTGLCGWGILSAARELRK